MIVVKAVLENDVYDELEKVMMIMMHEVTTYETQTSGSTNGDDELIGAGPQV